MISSRKTLRCFRLHFSFLCLSILVSQAGYGQDHPSSPLEGAAFSASPTEISAAAATIPPSKDAPVTVLYEEDKNQLDADGRVTNSHRLIYRIETQAGVESWTETSVEWESFYQKEPTLRARIIRTDGALIELDQKTITDVPARNESEGTYSDERIHKAPLPGLGIGAIVETETTRIDKEPYFSSGGVYRFYFQRGVPIAESRIIVEAAAALPLQYRTGFLSDTAIKDDSVDGVRRLVFEERNLPAAINSDIALATREQHTPWAEVSTGKSWEAVAQSYRLLAEPQIQPDQVKAFVSRATATATPPADPQARLALIQQLVSELHREVRYTGIEFGQSKLQPEQPSEVLKRHYGDCKDKASLLVAMLRASGISADLALLNAGPGRDVTPELPGMNQFDHAIVYVPATGTGDKPLWIDATAEFTKVGELPYGDQGRLALVIAETSKALSKTPEAHPEDSVLVETREFYLADYGPSRVVESSQTTGYVDSSYRASYGDTTNKELRTNLESYVRNIYAAKSLGKVEGSDPKDFSKPFVLRLEIEKSKRGNTGITDGAVAMYPTGAFSNLPRWFSVDPDAEGRKLTAEEEADRAKAQQQRAAEYDLQPFIAERRYRITPPAGFVLRALPADKTTQMGPAVLTQTFTSDQAGILTAVFRFTTGKERYTVDEALALRTAVIAANKEDAVMAFFDQAGSKQIAAGKVREGLATDRTLVESRPNDPLPHIRLAYALLTAGVGEAARAEAVKATVLAPKSALAYATLGWVLQFNMIGVHFGPGFDLNGAVEAYRKAKELDPEDLEIRENLAILYEYDTDGVRYASVPGLKNAIEEYRELTKVDKATGERYEDNILFDLLYSQQYKELLAELGPLPSTLTRSSLGISATIALNGLDAGIKRADQIPGDAAQRSSALRNSGSQLIALRLYPEATGVLSAGLQGQQDVATVARQVEIFRNLQPYKPAAATEWSSEAVVKRLIAAGLANKLDAATIPKLISRAGYPTDAAWLKAIKKNEDSGGGLASSAERSGFSPITLSDIMLGTMKVTTKGDDATGYRVTIQLLGAGVQQFFVDKEEGSYKIVASQDDFAEVGNAALYFLHHGNEPMARSLLDWKRDAMHKGGGDDPLSGPLLPRFWTTGESQGADAIELASASLLTFEANIADLLPAIAARRDKWTAGKPDQTDLNLLLAMGYYRIGNAAGARKAGEALVKDWPDSASAVQLAGNAYSLDHDWAAWTTLVDGRLAKHPTDREMLLEKSRIEQAQDNFAAARKSLHAVLDSNDVTAGDYNNYAWNSLFEKSVDADAIQAAQQSNMLSKNSSFAALHTLACLYAAAGKTVEAKETLLQAMHAANMGKPDPETWFAFGAIYEQYGVADAATTAFRKVEKPDRPLGPTDTYVLAQAHLKSLAATP